MEYANIEIYTDGGCSGNPGPGGWAFVLRADSVFEKEASGGAVATTNNRMELQAVIEALKTCLNYSPKKIIINTDSQYVKNGITAWITNWKRNGWRTANKAPVKNKEYWIELDSLNSQLPVTWNWVKGHAGIELNERCDSLVRKEMDAIIKG
ncbi:ribonuclease HI [uncultured Sphaerochaeta sp.]|uniref:ribonuclease HI n=1 Tax=uncultured Sphaerochaeta sp. TaxID=886478 RepID=UPI002A0A875A|nr:ribonuclease HI [uncultured Sphaerochaeta sp.]